MPVRRCGTSLHTWPASFEHDAACHRLDVAELFRHVGVYPQSDSRSASSQRRPLAQIARHPCAGRHWLRARSDGTCVARSSRPSRSRRVHKPLRVFVTAFPPAVSARASNLPLALPLTRAVMRCLHLHSPYEMRLVLPYKIVQAARPARIYMLLRLLQSPGSSTAAVDAPTDKATDSFRTTALQRNLYCVDRYQRAAPSALPALF